MGKILCIVSTSDRELAFPVGMVRAGIGNITLPTFCWDYNTNNLNEIVYENI